MASGGGALAYDQKPLRVPMKPSPSATYSNLVQLSGSLCYAHTRQACVTDPGSAVPGQPLSVRKVESQYTDYVHCIKAMPHGATGYLLVCTEAGIQVWDKQGLHLLFVWSFPDTDITSNGAVNAEASKSGLGSRHGVFARGAAINIAADGSANICFGASSGLLHVLEVDEAGRFRGPSMFSHHTSPITAISSAYQARQGRWTEDLSSALVTADEAGEVTVWAAESAGSYKATTSLGTSGTPAVALAVRNDFVIAGRLDGTIQVFGLRDKQLRAEIAAHSRWLTCMDIHPTKDIIVTGAEDGTINVFSLPINAQKTYSLLSAIWMHAAVTGVAFCGPTYDDVAAVAYDTDELQIYRMTSLT